MPVPSLTNDAHAAARGSDALSPASGLAENCRGGDGTAGARAGARSPDSANSGRAPGAERLGYPPAPSGGHLPGVAGPGPGSAPQQLRGCRPRAQRPEPGRDRTPQGLRRELGAAPRGSASRVGGQSRAGGRTGRRRRRRRGRGCGTEGPTRAGWLRVGLMVTEPRTGASS